jgi:hypothetical protein
VGTKVGQYNTKVASLGTKLAKAVFLIIGKNKRTSQRQEANLATANKSIIVGAILGNKLTYLSNFY